MAFGGAAGTGPAWASVARASREWRQAAPPCRGRFPLLAPGLFRMARPWAAWLFLSGLVWLVCLGPAGRRSVTLVRRAPLCPLTPTGPRVLASGRPLQHALRRARPGHPRRRIASRTPLDPDGCAGLARRGLRLVRLCRGRSLLSVARREPSPRAPAWQPPPARQHCHDGYLAQRRGTESAANRGEANPGRGRGRAATDPDRSEDTRLEPKQKAPPAAQRQAGAAGA